MVYRVLGAERVEKVVDAEEDACLHIQTRAFCVLSRFHDLDILDWHHTTVPTLFGDELTLEFAERGLRLCGWGHCPITSFRLLDPGKSCIPMIASCR